MVKKEMELAKSLQHQMFSDSSSARTTSHSPLLALPPELRNQIFSDVVKSTYRYIFVTPQGYDRPPLLETCKMIRADALRLFYYTNAFYGEIVHFDYSPISKFFAVPEAQNLRTFINFSLEVIGYPNWDNLVDWVKRYHMDTFRLPVHDVPERRGQPVRIILREFFAIARAMRGQQWEKLEARLYAARPALVALDRNWAL